MKRFGKKLAVMVTMMIMVLSMAVPTFAADATKRITSGDGGYSVENIIYCTYVKTTKFKKTIVLKQDKGNLYYKKVNGDVTTRSSYAKFKVVIKENNKNGKVIATKIWSNGTLKFKGKANKCYFVEATYINPVKGKVLFGPLYRQGWKKNAHWDAKAALF